MWTRFYYTSGAGNNKYKIILIEAPREKAEKIFLEKVGIDPYVISCTHCGNDYAITEEEDSLEDSIKFDLRLECNTIEDFLSRKDILVIRQEKSTNDECLIIISIKRYLSLLEDEEKLNRLEAGGVDNWRGYSDSIDFNDLDKWKENKEKEVLKGGYSC